MKNLGRTIDQLIKIEPSLESKLLQIKNKWRRFPGKTMAYWKELIDYLNSEPVVQNHPRHSDIKSVVVPKKPVQRKILSSFNQVAPIDTVVGVIPEDIADEIRRQDRKAITLAKLHLEANMTRNIDLLSEVNRSEMLLEIATKKIWVRLKDRFNLWTSPNSAIKLRSDGLLVVVEFSEPPVPVGPGLVKMDVSTMRNFFKFLGIDPPPGMPDEDNSPFLE
jgi:hypothetical protein